jgi:hypothetical protein
MLQRLFGCMFTWSSYKRTPALVPGQMRSSGRHCPQVNLTIMGTGHRSRESEALRLPVKADAADRLLGANHRAVTALLLLPVHY